MPDDKNILWIGANILFDLRTGETKQVLQLVYREDDASIFTKSDADNYLVFVSSRAAQFAKFNWFVAEAFKRRGFDVIRGEQDV